MYKPLWVQGAHKIRIGEAGLFMRCSLIVEEQSWKSSGPAVSFGDRVIVLPFASIGAAESVIIEDDVAIGSFAMIRDAEHQRKGRGEWTESHAAEGLERRVGNPTGYGPIDVAPVRIGRGAAIGDRVAVLPGSQIGMHSFIGTNSVVRGNIPDYSVAVGAPARVVGTTRLETEGHDPARGA